MMIRFRCLVIVTIITLIAESTFSQPGDSKLDTAWAGWKRGDIVRASELATESNAGPRRDHLRFLCLFVRGQYDAALAAYGEIPPSYAHTGELDRSVVDCYLHLGRNDEAAKFATKRKLGARNEAQLRAAKPLKVSLDKLSVIPFGEHDLTDYFPAFNAQLEGQAVTVHVDTGAPFLVMGPKHAKSLGIELIDRGFGSHGARRVKAFFGIANSFQLGDGLLENVPVIVLESVKHIILGTNVFQQFHSTLDYPKQRLILSPRTDTELLSKHMALLPERRTTMPFYMWGDHFMFARGSVGDDHDLNFFVDTGLVALRKIGDQPTVQAGFTSSRSRYRDWGFPDRELAQGIFKSHLPIGLGPLRQDGIWFKAGPGGEKQGTQTFGGVQMHGLIAHAFLKQYSWTIDFEKRTYIFSQ